MRRLALRGPALLGLPVAALAGIAGMAHAQATPPASPRAVSGDGIAKADFQAAMRGRMMQADKDGDGRISAAEWTAAAQSRGRGQMADRAFARMDRNRDGFLDAAELDVLAAQRFDRQDGNHDGRLSPEERKASRATMRGRMGQGASGEGAAGQDASDQDPAGN